MSNGSSTTADDESKGFWVIHVCIRRFLKWCQNEIQCWGQDQNDDYNNIGGTTTGNVIVSSTEKAKMHSASPRSQQVDYEWLHILIPVSLLFLAMVIMLTIVFIIKPKFLTTVFKQKPRNAVVETVSRRNQLSGQRTVGNHYVATPQDSMNATRLSNDVFAYPPTPRDSPAVSNVNFV